MGDLWRSKKMKLVKVSFHSDNARDVLEAIGEQDLLELRDLRAGTTFFNRSFVEEVRNCDNLSLVVEGIGEAMAAADVTIPEWPTPNDLNDKGLPRSVPKMESFEPYVRELDVELSLARQQLRALQSYQNTSKEAVKVLELGKGVYRNAYGQLKQEAAAVTDLEMVPLSDSASSPSPTLAKDMVSGSSMQLVCGTVKTESIGALERIIWRATRCNVFFHSQPIDEKLLDAEKLSKDEVELVDKTFFMVFLVARNPAEKVKKICSYFGADLYPFPQGDAEYAEKKEASLQQLDEAEFALQVQRDQIYALLSKSAGDHGVWKYVCAREKMIYDALNKSDYDIKRSQLTSIEGWIPADSLSTMQQALKLSEGAKGRTAPIINIIPSRVLTPPTYLPVTAFTSGFQALVNTYGTPRYREANPGAFCCIMFPYLFGIMFGDLGHGVLLAMFGMYLISKEKEWENAKLSDMLAMVYGGRYIILLNGLFGAFVGVMYNEAFAYPMALFGPSHWLNDEMEVQSRMNNEMPYPAGVDPIWHLADNKITFFNSLKMKISIVVGVIQMTVGIVISLLNHFEYKDYKKVFFQFIPEIVFFQGIFGYLVFAIFYKWATNWEELGQPAPSLLNMLILMFMSPTTPIDEPLYAHQCYTDCSSALADGVCRVSTIAHACSLSCDSPVPFGEEPADILSPFIADVNGTSVNEFKVCFSDLQSSIQLKLLIAAFVAVPFLLLPIPFIEMHEHNKANKKLVSGHEKLTGDDDDDDVGGGAHGDHGEEFSMGDAFIHQGIHTIEFVLGSISNTASYLRLWALSLAHSQLAELFKDMVLGSGINAASALGAPPVVHVLLLWFTFAMWAVMSFAVLMGMENLSSFLHALRLQWVEFQNKFYYGDGLRFQPLSFRSITEAEAEE
jgi:V-type H+-transporting ATPase subunit a